MSQEPDQVRAQDMEAPLLSNDVLAKDNKKNKTWRRSLWFLVAFIAIITIVGLIVSGSDLSSWPLGGGSKYKTKIGADNTDIVESEHGVVAADDGRCSEIGASMLRQGGHAVDAAVATALCVGVVNPMASGIGGGAFMMVRSSSTSQTQAFDMRETAPLAASEVDQTVTMFKSNCHVHYRSFSLDPLDDRVTSNLAIFFYQALTTIFLWLFVQKYIRQKQNMYENNPMSKTVGALAMGVPGEIAGLHEAWLKYGRLAWRTLFQPAIKLAKDGFVIKPYLGNYITRYAKIIMNDPGLSQVFAPNGKVLEAGDMCYNVELSRSLEAVAEEGPQALYNGTVGEKLVKDVREAGGILTMEDLRNYTVEVTDAMTVNVMGYTILGMPPPSSGTLGLSLVLKIFESYGNSNAAKGDLGLHRLVEALKHMFAVRMNLGDPNFVDITNYTFDMLSPSFAKQIRQKILDNTTFPPEYYMSRWSQLRDHGTSHFCIVDADRNAVSMTTTVNYPFGALVLSPSTGILLNNEMGDFSTPTEISPDKLPPAPSNFIKPNKRPLSSMTPIIVTKDDELAGVVGGSGGMNIIPAVLQVFLNHFILGMEPLAAVQNPRVYHKLIPNVVCYENWTVIDGYHIELSDERKIFLKERGHQLKAQAGGAIVQLVVQTLQNHIYMGRKSGKYSNANLFHGTLTAVSDPRKDGRPAAV